MKSLDEKKILLGVTGGIAAYKACTLVNMLIARKAQVRVVMTENSKKFVTPLTFEALSNHPVYDDLWNSIDKHSIEHISLSHWPDIIIISPATANTIAKIALGLADNLLTTIVLASLPKIKVIIAPAMNSNMWCNDLVQKNINILKKIDKFEFIEPRSGILACRDEGKGKIADNEVIMNFVEKILS
jgi:phosphopantothenoylcysteine decarboxylase/phosphopantothenate--cysteine ligase